MELGIRFLGAGWDYEPVWQAMYDLTDNRTQDTQDEVWLLQHKPVFTQGQAGKAEHVLMPGDIPIVQSDRGGQVTYHGPGQLVAYVMTDLRRKNIGPRELVTNIEQSIVGALSEFGIQAYPKADAPGVYVERPQENEAKIASLGLRIRKGFSFHGLALNVDMDLEPFLRINPCGYAGMAMTQMADLIPQVDIESVGQKLIDQITNSMSYEGVQDLGDKLP